MSRQLSVSSAVLGVGLFLSVWAWIASAPQQFRTAYSSPKPQPAYRAENGTEKTVLQPNITKQKSRQKSEPIVAHGIDAQLETPKKHEFREEGDTMQFRGYTIIKLRPQYQENSLLGQLQDDWNNEASHYLSSALGFSAEKVSSYQRIKTESFREYDEKTSALLNEAQRIYGSDIDIAIEKDLKTLHIQTWDRYHQALNKMMGKQSFEDYVQFKQRYRLEALKQVGYIPAFIR